MLASKTHPQRPISRDTYAVLVKQYLASTSISVFSNTSLAFAIWVFLLTPSEKLITAGWLIAVVAISFIRLGFATSTLPHRLTSHSLSFTLGTGSVASGLLWGLLPWIINWEIDSSHHMFIPYILAGTAAGGMVINSFLLFPVWGWMVAVLVPGSIPFLLTGMYHHKVLFGISLLYCVFLLKTSYFLHHIFRRTTELRLEREQALITLQEKHQALAETTEKMEQAKESAQKASRYKTEFLARMSHEIRTPLNAIVGFTSLSLETAKDPEQLGNLRLIQESASSLLSIVNDVLDISKIEAGKLNLNEYPFKLQTEFTRIQSLFTQLTEEKHIALRFDCGNEPIYLKGDALRLNQVIINLVGNAIKFSGAGSVVVVEATIKERTDAHARIVFSVTDSGIGIPEDKQRSIFEAFEQADNSITRRHGGTGLGLSISSSLVSMMGGTISLESTMGKGSRFWFEIQFQTLTLPEIESLQNTEASSVSARKGGEPSSRKLNILVAEDNPVNQKVTQRLLESAGHEVTIAANGAEAVACSEKDRFDIILMDCSMPIVDGYEAANLIRKIDLQRNVPIIALTAHAFAGEKARCLAAGMDDYLCKPFHRRELLEMIHQRCLSRGSN